MSFNSPIAALVAALAMTLLFGTPANATILVTFSGAVDSFNPGPLTADSPLEGSFEIDDSVASTGVNMLRTFAGVVDSFRITVSDTVLGTVEFTGENGTMTQFCQNDPPGTPPNDAVTPCDPGTRFVGVSIGDGDGTVVGDANGFALDSVDFDLRGDALFANPFGFANDLEVSDFDFARMTMHFQGTSFSLERSLDTLTFSQVPEPGASVVIGLGAIVLGRRARTARRASR